MELIPYPSTIVFHQFSCDCRPEEIEAVELSVFDIKDHPDYKFRPGHTVIRIGGFEVSQQITILLQRNPLISNDRLSDEKLLLSDHCYYPHFHFRHMDSKKSALNGK